MLQKLKNAMRKMLLGSNMSNEERTLRKMFTLSDNISDEIHLLGSAYGGWYLPRSFTPTETDVLYCIGAGEDISFDCALAQGYPSRVFTFDPTPKAFKHYSDVVKQFNDGVKLCNSESSYYRINICNFNKITFFTVGVSNKNGKHKFYFPQNTEHVSCSTDNIQNTTEYFEAECYTIKQLLINNKHNIPYLIKMDIEGAEYAVLKNIIEDNILPKFLAVEFHSISSDTNNVFYDTIVMLKKSGMNCIHVNWPDVVFMRES